MPSKRPARSVGFNLTELFSDEVLDGDNNENNDSSDKVVLNDGDDCCCICLNEPICKPTKADPCQHTFCFECLQELFRHSLSQSRCPRCPLCRLVIESYPGFDRLKMLKENAQIRLEIFPMQQNWIDSMPDRNHNLISSSVNRSQYNRTTVLPLTTSSVMLQTRINSGFDQGGLVLNRSNMMSFNNRLGMTTGPATSAANILMMWASSLTFSVILGVIISLFPFLFPPTLAMFYIFFEFVRPLCPYEIAVRLKPILLASFMLYVISFVGFVILKAWYFAEDPLDSPILSN